MKLHLPKALCAIMMAILGGFASSSYAVDANNATVTVDGVTYLNVGRTTNTYNWTGDLVIGDTAEQQGDIDKLGAFDEQWNFLTPDDDGKATSHVSVTGNILVQGSGQVLIGGQVGSNHRGIDADVVTVNGTGNITHLDAGRARFNELHIISGKAEINYTSGATGGNTIYSPTFLQGKTACVKNKLNVEGGYVVFGYYNAQSSTANQGHYMTVFGASKGITLTQSGGDIDVWAGAAATGGMSITQSNNAQRLVFRDEFKMASAGTNTITQSGDSAKLVFGRLLGSYANTFNFTQSGKGLIHLAYGADFTKASTINFVQTGAGTIKLGGGHDTSITSTLQNNFNLSGFLSNNVTYTIDQENSSGTVNLASNAAINATSLKQGANATLNINGTLNLSGTDNVVSGAVTLGTAGTLNLTGALKVESGSTLHFDVDAKNKAAIQAAEGGNLTVMASTVSVSMSETLQSTMESEAMAKLETLDSFTYTIDLIKLSSADSAELAKLIDDEQLVLSMALPQTMATASEDLDYTITQGLQVENNVLQATVTWQAVTADEQVPEPATATLSLLALAGLAARRRRASR